MENLIIPTPSIPEQEAIIRILDDLLKKERNAKVLYALTGYDRYFC